MTDLTVGQIRDAMQRVVYGSVEWQTLNLCLASKYCSLEDLDSAKKRVEKVSESKLTDEAKVNYFTLLAALAQHRNDVPSIVDYLKKAKSADRALQKPRQQFELTKQIAIVCDSNGLLDEACAEWQLLIDDFKSFEHLEHQPLLASKFLAQTLQKQGKITEAAAVKQKWFAEQTEIVLARHGSQAHFTATNKPKSFDDELTNFFERCRQNIFQVYGNHPELVEHLKKRNAEFWVGSESLRIKIMDFKEASGNKHLSDKEQLPSFFYMRCMSTYLAAIQLATAGQIPEAFGALRMCLENALYAFHVFEKPEDAEIWLDRPCLGLGEINAEKKAKRKKIGHAFGPSKIIDDVTAKSQTVGDESRFYYEMTIDAGAHPNVDVLKSQASQSYQGSTYVFGLDFLEPLSSEQCCKTILAATKTVLDIFRLAEWIW